MAKYKSRAVRLSEACSLIQNVVGELNKLADSVEVKEVPINSAPASRVESLISDIDTSEIESLKDEIEQWKSGMEGTNLENTQKYQDLSSCYDTLETGIDALQNIDSSLDITSEDADSISSDITEKANEIDSALCDLENAEFPRMF
jgi:chromosome segregation ATPase